MEGPKQRLQKRLSSYWKMEVANALLVPGFMVIACLYTGQAIGVGLALACVPMCGLLIVGGLYWRAKLLQMEGRDEPLDYVLGLARQWRLPLLATTCSACVLAVGVWFTDLAASTGERWSITIAAVLAALEYVNYYHRQLQNFDHWPDFKRFLATRSFPVAWMARDLERFEAEREASGSK